MSCLVLESLASAVAAVEALPVLSGLGAGAVLEGQVDGVAGAVGRLQRELAVRMAALERAAAGVSDVRGAAVRAGVDPRRAGLLRRVGVFADADGEVGSAWRSGEVRLEQVDVLRAGTGRVPAGLRRRLVAEVLPLLPGLDERATRRLVEFAVDQLAPGDPDHEERAENAARRLAWSRIPGSGGLAFEGYLPAGEGAAFTTAIDALVASLRVCGDGLTAVQRRADGLAALVAAATEDGLPSGGGLPAAMTLTVSLSEAARVAAGDPAGFGSRIRIRPRGQSTIGGEPAGDATVRFGMCCAAITPILTDQPGTRPSHDSDDASGGSPPTLGGPGDRSSPLDGPSVHGAEAVRGKPAIPSGRAGFDRAAAPARPAIPDGPAIPAGRAGPDRAAAPNRPAGELGSLLDRIARTPVQPLAVGRSVRLATPAQRHALRLRDRGCVIPGCDIDAAYTQPHHVIGWAIGGTTDLDQLVALCWVHHRLTELGRFTFTPRIDGEPRPDGSLEHPHWGILHPSRQAH